MNEWTVVGVIVVLLGLLGTVTAPMIKLNTTLTKLNDKFETLDSKLTNVTESNHEFPQTPVGTRRSAGQHAA